MNNTRKNVNSSILNGDLISQQNITPRPLHVVIGMLLLFFLSLGASYQLRAETGVQQRTEITAWRDQPTFIRQVGYGFHLHRFIDQETRMTCYALTPMYSRYDDMPSMSCVKSQKIANPNTHWRQAPTFIRRLPPNNRYHVHRIIDGETGTVCHMLLATSNRYDDMASISCQNR